jgi:hypothetical protein
MSPDPSQLYYANPNNPQSLNLYTYAQNSPLVNIDPTGMSSSIVDSSDEAGDMVEESDHISSSRTQSSYNDKVIGSHDEPCRDGSGYICHVGDYDGEINCDQSAGCVQWHTECQCWGEISGPDKLDSDPAALSADISPMSMELIRLIAKDTASFPAVCSVGAYGQIGIGGLSSGGSFDSKSGGSGRVEHNPFSNAFTPFSMTVKGDTKNNISGGVTIRDPVSGVGGGVSVSNKGTTTVSASLQRGIFIGGATATLGTIGNAKCRIP